MRRDEYEKTRIPVEMCSGLFVSARGFPVRWGVLGGPGQVLQSEGA